MQNVMVTGTGRRYALGYNLVLRYLENGDRVIAAVRKESSDLKELKKKYADRLLILIMDIGSTESVERAHKEQLLWMIGEIGEVVDIIKKHGGDAASRDKELRAHLIEEMADVLMYYNDILLCYGITAEELKQSYISKFEKNMKRW